MTGEAPKIREVFLVALPRPDSPGHEQIGLRPAVVVGLPDSVATPRYPMLIIAPVSTRRGPWSLASPELYPELRAGAGGLPKDSIVLLDQIRSIDARRIKGTFGRLDARDYEPLRLGLARIFVSPESPHPRRSV